MSDTKPSYYGGPPAADFLTAKDPFALFDTWFADAVQHEINDPNGMALATADADGMPNVRMVLLKGLDPAAAGPDRGFVFYTNFESAKGREILAAKKAALLFHWKTLRRQVRVRGHVTQVSATEADAYYASRPRGSRLGAWASQQSRPLGEIPRPPHWSGLRVTPIEMEFWHDRPFRLHDRVVFRRDTAGTPWVSSALYP
jgi:pyridoxamine 5'-phosphate oxidase